MWLKRALQNIAQPSQTLTRSIVWFSKTTWQLNTNLSLGKKGGGMSLPLCDLLYHSSIARISSLSVIDELMALASFNAVEVRVGLCGVDEREKS